MTVSGLVKSSLIDYPSHVSCVLFVPGCNYDCFYCHNRFLIDGTHEVLDNKLVGSFMKKRVGLLDGVVISGGEPTLQPDLVSYIASIKEMGYRVKLDTNGSSPQIVKQLLQSGLCDYFAVDYKAPAYKYKELARGTANASQVQHTIYTLLENDAAFDVRTTVIPQLRESDLITMAQELPKIPRYVLNRYRRPEKYQSGDEALINQTPYSKEQLLVFANAMRTWQPNIET